MQASESQLIQFPSPKLPVRPKRSIKFPKLCQDLPNIISNHFPLLSFQMKNKIPFIHLYKISFFPDVPPDSRRLISRLIRSISEKITKEIGVFNYSGMVVFSDRRNLAVLTFESIIENSEKYVISLKYSSQIDTSSLKEATEVSEQLTQFFNIQLKNIMKKLHFYEFGLSKKYFNMKNSYIDEFLNLEILKGFTTSIGVYNSGVKMLVNSCSKFLSLDTVLHEINELFFKRKYTKNDINDELTSKRVVADYGNNRNYKLTGVNFELNPKSTFVTDKGEISYVDYYWKNYTIKIKNLDQPLLEVKQGKKTIHLIPELVRLEWINKKSSKKTSQKSSSQTKIQPDQRMNEIKDHSYLLTKENAKMSAESVCKFKFGDQTAVSAARLNPPLIEFATTSKTPRNGLFEIKDEIRESANFENWTFIYPENLYKDASRLYEELKEAAWRFGINVKEPVWCEIQKNSSDLIEKLKSPTTITKDTQFVLALISAFESSKDEIYTDFKRYCFISKPIPSQFVLNSSLQPNKIRSVCSKIVLQINAKLGSSLWAPSLKNLEIANKDMMVIGADVFHNYGKNKQSVIGLCASFDQDFTKYYSRVKFQAKGKEIMENISALIADCLTYFFKINKFLPKSIVFYRDGVGESQYETVRTIEIPSILAGFKKMGENYKPKFCEILVNKRIDDKFFAEGERYENPPSGTWVFDKVVSKKFYDFFLCAQNVTQGTTTPTHYTVVYDEIGLPEDILASFTYYQCFNYYNWNGAVRVPACAQYAHKVAYMAGETLGKDYDESLRNRPVFL